MNSNILIYFWTFMISIIHLNQFCLIRNIVLQFVHKEWKKEWIKNRTICIENIRKLSDLVLQYCTKMFIFILIWQRILAVRKYHWLKINVNFFLIDMNKIIKVIFNTKKWFKHYVNNLKKFNLWIIMKLTLDYLCIKNVV